MIKIVFRCSACLVLMLLMGLPAVARSQSAARPTLVVETLDGKVFNLANERGKWVIVNFWATWCSPCLAEMPAISEYVATHKNVTAIGLDYQPESLATVVEFVRKHPVDYPLAKIDYVKPLPGLAMPKGLPETDLIAPDGHLAKHFVGPINAKLLDAAIAEAKSHADSGH
ncbi:MAG TPA: TlpA disulfide reductase family protein [Rhodanobacteraceae bacterium]